MTDIVDAPPPGTAYDGDHVRDWRALPPSHRRAVDRGRLEEMGARLRHRGPDGEGLHVDGAVGLVHRRLAIIDLEGGAQPMCDPEGRVWLSYNGEVYNYLELREELEQLGHQFRSASDTEVVLAAYLEWGLDFPKRLNGMFALAIWDGRKRRLVLCRDRLGIKPLYYALTPDGVVFASELKALRVVDGVANQLDLDALDEFMSCGYVVHPRSVVAGVKKSTPAPPWSSSPSRSPSHTAIGSSRFARIIVARPTTGTRRSERRSATPCVCV
jgi:asparagine synthase (glutamine-hydrolysing)